MATVKLNYGSGFDVTESPADQFNITLDIGESPLSTLASLAGRAGGQTLIGGTGAGESLTLQSTAHATRGRVIASDPVRLGAIEDMGGTTRYALATASPHHTFTGDAVISGQAAISAPAIGANHLMTIGGGGTYGGKIGLHIGLGSTLAGGSGNLIGVGGYCLIKDASDSAAFGLDYIAGIQGQNAASAVAVRGQIYAGGSGKLITDAYDFIARSPVLVLGNVTNIYGFYAETLSAGTTRRHPFYDAGTAASGNNRGNVFKSSTQFFKDLDLGGGSAVLGIGPATTVPTSNPTGGVILYVDPADNRLKCRGSAGTVTVLANP